MSTKRGDDEQHQPESAKKKKKKKSKSKSIKNDYVTAVQVHR